MILCFPGSSFKRNNQYPLLTEKGVAVTLALNYSITAPITAAAATKVDSFTVGAGSDFLVTISAGDNICINIDGFDTMNVITGVDTTNKRIKLKNPLLASGLTFKASIKEYTYNILSTATEGFFRFKDGESVLIRSEIQTMSVDYASVIARDVSLSTQIMVGDFTNLNKEALNSVYADLSYLKDVWNVIDIGQFRELIILKLLAMADHKDSIKHITNYSTYKDNFINLIKLNTETSPLSTDIEEKIQEGAWHFRLGAR